MLPDRLFRKLDRARLDATLTRHAIASARPWIAAISEGHAAFKADGSPDSLARGAQGLVDQLCEEFVLGRKTVRLRDEPRPHRRRGGKIVFELHGQCRKGGSIEVFVRTAAYQRPIAVKSLLDTLLHEFVHHHDFDAFGVSVHCSGFYERLGQLYRPLRQWVER